MVRPSLLFPLCILLTPLSSAAQSSHRFESCDQYDRDIIEAVAEYWPDDFQEPNAWKAQLYQESLCDAKAVSHVGAKGIAQFMSETAHDMSRIFKKDFDAFDAEDSIRYGAYYIDRRSRTWRRRGRTHEQALELGQACYNAGCGNILKAQSKAGNARLWADISPHLHRVTGESNSHETITYVARIKQWRRELDALPAPTITPVAEDDRFWLCDFLSGIE